MIDISSQELIRLLAYARDFDDLQATLQRILDRAQQEDDRLLKAIKEQQNG